MLIYNYLLGSCIIELAMLHEAQLSELEFNAFLSAVRQDPAAKPQLCLNCSLCRSQPSALSRVRRCG